MPKIIVTSRYIKNASRAGVGKLVRYMGTREGVEKLKLTDQTSPATKKQDHLIRTLTSKAPESYGYPEFTLYLEKKTKAAAMEFIDAWVERNADKADGIKKLVSYMAERPGVEKLGKHGLCSQEDEPIDLDSTADEISNHPGILWTHVISLRREDAERLNYQKAEAWKDLLRRNTVAIAQAHKIDVTNLRWVAAFHNTSHHPHCHLMVYAADAKQGYLTNQGIESLRKTMGQDVFRQEMYHLFKMEAHLRDKLKLTAKKALQDYIERSREIRPAAEPMQQLFEKLIQQMNTYKGRKVYGYLPKSIKDTVNEIVTELAKDDRIASFYKEWNRVNRQKLSLYYEKEKPIIPLEDNKEFRSIKNSIIQAAEELWEQSGATIENKEFSSHKSAQSFRIPSYKIDSAVCGLIQSLGKMFQNNCQKKYERLHKQVDSKLASKIAQKKAAHGLRVGFGSQPESEPEEQHQHQLLM